jgi:hypothetical protein
MGNFTLQKDPCSFLKLRISPWEISFPLLLCSLIPGASFCFHCWRFSLGLHPYLLWPPSLSPLPGPSKQACPRLEAVRGAQVLGWIQARRLGAGRRAGRAVRLLARHKRAAGGARGWRGGAREPRRRAGGATLRAQAHGTGAARRRR